MSGKAAALGVQQFFSHSVVFRRSAIVPYWFGDPCPFEGQASVPSTRACRWNTCQHSELPVSSMGLEKLSRRDKIWSVRC